MDIDLIDGTLSFMVDGNSLAGLLYELFDQEMTVAPVECASCGQEGELGSLWAFNASPGYVLCCPSCQKIIMRMTVAPNEIYLDARGALYIRIPKRG